MLSRKKNVNKPPKHLAEIQNLEAIITKACCYRCTYSSLNCKKSNFLRMGQIRQALLKTLGFFFPRQRTLISDSRLSFIRIQLFSLPCVFLCYQQFAQFFIYCLKNVCLIIPINLNGLQSCNQILFKAMIKLSTRLNTWLVEHMLFWYGLIKRNNNN